MSSEKPSARGELIRLTSGGPVMTVSEMEGKNGPTQVVRD